MRVAGRMAVLAAIVGLMASTLSAQWARHPTPGVPRLPDGKPDLTAPAPRTADGKPDFSGLWRGFGAGGPGGTAAPPPGGPPVAGFRDVAQNIKEGLPLTPEGQEILKVRVAGNSKDNPEAHCLPMGIVQLHTQGAPRKFIQTPREVVILYEASSERRESSPTAAASPPTTRSPGTTAIPPAAGRATRSWSRRSSSRTAAGSISSAARSATRAK